MTIWQKLSDLIAADDSRKREPNELLLHEWDTLKILWEAAKKDSGFQNPAVDALFPPSNAVLDPQTHGWRAFNAAELAVGEQLSDAQLAAEYDTLLDMARARAIPQLARFERDRALFAASAGADGTVVQSTPPGQRHSAYRALLYSLQTQFIEGRFARTLRGEIATRLLRTGILATLLTLLIPFLYVLYCLYELAGPARPLAQGPQYPLLFDESFVSIGMAATFGMLGAYFSRMIRFQGSLATITFEDATTTYLKKVLRLRMLYGMIGALIFYFVIRGGLISGALLPKLDNLALAEEVRAKVLIAGSKALKGADGKVFLPYRTVITLLVPSPELAKLFIWSFIAGFSEALLPDALAKIEQGSAPKPG